MFLTMLIAVALQAAVPAEADRQALEALNSAWLNAYVANDRAALESILAEDFVATYSGGVQRSRAEVIRSATSRRPPIASVRWENLNIQVAGDTAVVTGRSILTIAAASQREIRNDYADVYVRRNGRWRAISAHVVRAPEP